MDDPSPEAAHYGTDALDNVVCGLCPHGCFIVPGQRGRCRARHNDGGALRAGAYGRITAKQVDPIEKKPLYHYLPGASILSIGSFGCNLSCRFCHNFTISQARAESASLPPDALVAEMRRTGSPGVAYTYNEPLVNFEYLRDAGRAVRAAKGHNVLVTNGYVNPGPLAELLPLVDAMNIDVKAFEDAFYRELCGGELAHVLRTVEASVAARAHVELTLLVIPGANDAPKPNEDFARWIADRCGPDTPLHLTAYYPRYQYHVGPTPPSTLERLRAIYARTLRYVYVGNLGPGASSDTRCPSCGAVAIARSAAGVDRSGLTGAAACARCGTPIPVVL